MYMKTRKEKLIMKKLRRTLPLLLAFVLILTTACGSNKKVTIEMAQAYLNDGNYEEAIEAYTALIEVDPNNIDLYMGRADAYVYTQKYQEAIADYTSVVGIDDAYIPAYSNRGVLYFTVDDLDNGEIDLNKVSTLASNEDRDAAFDAIRAYIDRLEFAEIDSAENDVYSATAFQLPGGGYIMIYRFSDGTYGVSSVPAGGEKPSLALENILYNFRWYNPNGYWYDGYEGPLFADVTDGSVTIEYGGNTQTLPAYYQAGGFYAGAYLLGSDNDVSAEMYMAMDTYNGSPNLVIGMVHAGDSQVFTPYRGQ